MSKETQITFRLDSELRDSFFQAVQKEDRPVAQVLRELMREYLSKGNSESSLKANK